MSNFKLQYLDTVGFNADQGGRGFHLPTAMTIREDGRIFVASRSNTAALNIVGIQVVDKDHGFFGQIGSYGHNPGEMMGPTALALDANNNLYLADDVLQRITVYDPEGELISTWGTEGDGTGEFNAPSGIVFDHDNLMYVVDHRNHRVQKFTKDGDCLAQWGSFGDCEGEFNLPWGIAIDPNGSICVADWRNDRVQRFSTQGEFLAQYGSAGNGDGELNRPAGLAIDADGNIFIADWGNQRVQVFDREGKFITKLRGQATLSKWSEEYFNAQADEKRSRDTFEPYFEVDTEDVNEISARIEPYFWDPVAMALDSDERAFVLETCRHRFQIYQKHSNTLQN